MNIVSTALPEVLLVEPAVVRDARGTFMEAYSAQRYADAGIPGPFVQDNVSRSARGVLRGLHYQHPFPQGKLVQVLDGEVLDVVVDIRLGSPRFGRWVAVRLSSDNRHQLWVPPGFAHGFTVTSESALCCYKCTEYRQERAEHAIRWDDEAIGIEWPSRDVLISARDRDAPLLRDVPHHALPPFVA